MLLIMNCGMREYVNKDGEELEGGGMAAHAHIT
jgi:hypothetical protein